MRFRKAKLVATALALVCMCTAGLGAGYTWTGGGVSPDWDLIPNWATLFCQSPCYPNSCNDDATIPSSVEAPWTVDLVTVAIDDLTISDDVNFGAAEVAPMLTVDILTINGPAAVTIVDATILATNLCP